MTGYALQVDALAGGYGDLCVFRGASVRLGANESLGILGPNGAGKTTLLRTLAGLLPALEGRVMLQGRDIGRLAAFSRTRGGLVMVPEGRQIIAGLSVEENLALTRASGRSGATPHEYSQRLEEIWTLFPRLSDRRTQAGDSLSGGEQQMLAIARALMMRPAVLLLDEPTQGLAPIIVNELVTVFQRLAGRFAFLLVEQNRDFLEALTSHVVVMRAGKLLN